MDFTPREIATAIWLGVGLIWVSKVAGKQLLSVFRALTRPVFLTIIGMSLSYIGAWIAILTYFKLWEISNLKTTLLWIITAASVGVARAISLERVPNFLTKTLRESLSITVFIEFLINTYTFDIWVELVLVPFAVFISLVLGVAQVDKKNRPAAILLQWVLAILGVIYIGHALSETAQHYHELETENAAREIFLPAALSLLFIPFLFVLNVYSVYDQIFMALGWSINQTALLRYAKQQAFMHFRTNLDYLNRWRRLVLMEHPDSRAGIDELFAELKAIRQRERNPPLVDPHDGWQPQAAIKFLQKTGFTNEDYHRTYNRWYSTSRAETIGNKWSLNTIFYRVSGNIHAANELSLELKVSNLIGEEAKQADKRFFTLIITLLTSALGAQKAQEFLSTADSESLEWIWNGLHITLTHKDWSHIQRGYEREFTIQTESAWNEEQKVKAELENFKWNSSPELITAPPNSQPNEGKIS